MPFKSEAQRRFLHMHEPELADKWEKLEASGNYNPEGKRKRVGGGIGRRTTMPDASFEDAVRRRLSSRGGQMMPSGRTTTSSRKITRKPSPSSSNVGRTNSSLQGAINRRMRRRASPRTY